MARSICSRSSIQPRQFGGFHAVARLPVRGAFGTYGAWAAWWWAAATVERADAGARRDLHPLAAGCEVVGRASAHTTIADVRRPPRQRGVAVTASHNRRVQR